MNPQSNSFFTPLEIDPNKQPIEAHAVTASYFILFSINTIEIGSRLRSFFLFFDSCGPREIQIGSKNVAGALCRFAIEP
jgi:hypothetical protein